MATRLLPTYWNTKATMGDHRYWFRRKRIGWGLEPGSREGWIAMIAFVIVDTGGTFLLMPFFVHSRPWLLIVWAFGWLAFFLAFVIAKGERLW